MLIKANIEVIYNMITIPITPFGVDTLDTWDPTPENKVMSSFVTICKSIIFTTGIVVLMSNLA